MRHRSKSYQRQLKHDYMLEQSIKLPADIKKRKSKFAAGIRNPAAVGTSVSPPRNLRAFWMSELTKLKAQELTSHRLAPIPQGHIITSGCLQQVPTGVPPASIPVLSPIVPYCVTIMPPWGLFIYFFCDHLFLITSSPHAVVQALSDSESWPRCKTTSPCASGYLFWGKCVPSFRSPHTLKLFYISC